MSGLGDEFLHKLRATFRVEAEEHLQAIIASLLALEAGPDEPGRDRYMEVAFRAAHSLKGAARAVNYPQVEQLCQLLEDSFASWKHGRDAPSAEAFDAAHRALDDIRGALGAEVLPQRAALAGETVPRRVPPAAASGTAERESADQTVRISIARLGANLLDVEELLATKLTASQRAAELSALGGQFGLWRREWSRMQPRLRALRADAAGVELADFLEWNIDFLRLMEGRVAELCREAGQDSLVTGRRVDDLLVASKKMLMLPLATLGALLPKVVRDLCRDQGKEAELRSQGGEVELDKRILEEMKDPLIHLLRNCIDHGVESPALRMAQGKPRRASISLVVSKTESGQVEIALGDDGAGIDVEALKAAAIERQRLTPEEAAALDPAAALQLVFEAEVSTSPIITELSGRGLGLAIVRERAERLGGSVSVESQPGLGTTFRIRLPVTLATFRGVLVRVAGQRFVLPTADVERAVRFRPAEVRTVEGRETLLVDARPVSLVDMAPLLGLAAPNVAGDHAQAVVLGIGLQRTAFAVEAILDEQEVLVKPLGRPLQHLPHVSGVTVLGSGQVVPILKAAELLRSARQAGKPLSPALATQPVAPARRVLVAEDSITSRQLIKGILEAAGYAVRTAIDGMEAFTLLRTESFDLVVSDVEMPRLGGFDLTRRIRADRRLAELPVILVTALETREDRERGIDAGASAYLVKSSFDQGNLLEAVGRLL